MKLFNQFIAVFDFLNKGKQTEVQVDDLSDLFDCTKRNVRLILNKMQNENWINWTPSVGRGNTSSLIFLMNPDKILDSNIRRALTTHDFSELTSYQDDKVKSVLLDVFALTELTPNTYQWSIPILDINKDVLLEFSNLLRWLPTHNKDTLSLFNSFTQIEELTYYGELSKNLTLKAETIKEVCEYIQESIPEILKIESTIEGCYIFKFSTIPPFLEKKLQEAIKLDCLEIYQLEEKEEGLIRLNLNSALFTHHITQINAYRIPQWVYERYLLKAPYYLEVPFFVSMNEMQACSQLQQLTLFCNLNHADRSVYEVQLNYHLAYNETQYAENKTNNGQLFMNNYVVNSLLETRGAVFNAKFKIPFLEKKSISLTRDLSYLINLTSQAKTKKL